MASRSKRKATVTYSAKTNTASTESRKKVARGKSSTDAPTTARQGMRLRYHAISSS